MNPMCYCGGHYRCDQCRHDVCFCTCQTDGTPETQAEVTAGYVNPSAARTDAWDEKVSLTR